MDPTAPLRGRGAQDRPPNRFERTRLEPDWSDLEEDEAALAARESPATEYLVDDARTIVSENDSPDIAFRYSVNPYRGCQHGCSYCYARPTHEYLGFSAGLDFETKVLFKPNAAELFRAWLARPGYRPEWVAFSGVTDCYQPVERRLRLTRACLEVAAACRHPVGIVTKNALVTRDADLLGDLARGNAARVALSITTLDPKLAATMEPRTSTPAARLRAIERLTQAGVPVTVMVAPLIPGLNDRDAPAVLRAAREAGAVGAGYTLLRLPLTVRPVFQAWLRAHYPDRVERVESLIRSTRGGAMNRSAFGERQRGAGPYAEGIAAMFRAFAKQQGLLVKLPPLDASAFRPPTPATGQQWLF